MAIVRTFRIVCACGSSSEEFTADVYVATARRCLRKKRWGFVWQNKAQVDLCPICMEQHPVNPTSRWKRGENA